MIIVVKKEKIKFPWHNKFNYFCNGFTTICPLILNLETTTQSSHKIQEKLDFYFPYQKHIWYIPLSSLTKPNDHEIEWLSFRHERKFSLYTENYIFIWNINVKFDGIQRTMHSCINPVTYHGNVLSMVTYFIGTKGDNLFLDKL